MSTDETVNRLEELAAEAAQDVMDKMEIVNLANEIVTLLLGKAKSPFIATQSLLSSMVFVAALSDGPEVVLQALREQLDSSIKAGTARKIHFELKESEAKRNINDLLNRASSLQSIIDQIKIAALNFEKAKLIGNKQEIENKKKELDKLSEIIKNLI